MTNATPLSDEELDSIQHCLQKHLYHNDFTTGRLLVTLVDRDATIAALKAERDAALSKLSRRIVHYCLCKGDGRESPVEGCDCVSCTTLRLEAEVARLKANQRTPGTVEVCSFCECQQDQSARVAGDFIERGPWATCEHPNCPIRRAK